MKLILDKDQTLWFTSDTHYNHANICRGTTEWDRNGENHFRDFDTLNHMNEVLVNNINSLVGQDDILIHLGDWSFGGFEKIEEFRSRIVCKNIHLTFGNHDHHIKNNKGDIQDLFSSVHDYLQLDIRRPSKKGQGMMDKYGFVCMHYPIASWDGLGRGTPHLHGHVHYPPERRIGKGRVMDVGVDGNNLFPISLDDVVKIVYKQPIDSFLEKDHHTIVENYK